MGMQYENANQITVRRVLGVAPPRVWQAWSDAEVVKRWWGPEYFTCPACRMDFRVGGRTLVCMHGPAGTEWDRDLFNTWTYTKIAPMELIEFLQNPSDANGGVVNPTSMGLRADFPTDVRTVVTLKPVDGQTEMTVTEHGFPAGEMLAQAQMGLNQTLDKLARAVGTR